MRVRIIQALATRLNTETDATVRRAVQESLYNALDENTGYLGTWIETASRKEDQNKINDGHEAAVRDQSQTVAKVLRTATEAGSEGYP